jgi:hypothetical protein
VVTAAHLHGIVMAALLCKERVGSGRAARRGEAAAHLTLSLSDGSDSDDFDVENAMRRAERILGASSQQQSQRWWFQSREQKADGGAGRMEVERSSSWWRTATGGAMHRLVMSVAHAVGGGRFVFWRRRKPVAAED